MAVSSSDQPLNTVSISYGGRWLVAFAMLMLAFYGLFHLASYFYGLVALLAITLVITYILLSPVNGLEAVFQKIAGTFFLKRFLGWLPSLRPRLVSVLLVYLAFLSLMISAVVWLLPPLSAQIAGFGQALPKYMGELEVFTMDVSSRVAGVGVWIKEKTALQETEAEISSESESQTSKAALQHSIFQSTLIQASKLLSHTAISAVDHLVEFITGTMRGLLYFVAGMVLTFYFLLDGPKLRDGFLKWVPTAHNEAMRYFLGSVHQVMSSFVKGQVLLGLMTGSYMFIIYSLFHVKYAIFLGVFFAISEFLPIVGTYIGFTPGIMVMLLSDDPWVTLYVFLCSYTYQTIKDNILTPKIVGNVMGLHPLVVILSLLVCAKLAGLLGILLALPVASIANIVWHYLVRQTQVAVPSSSIERAVKG